MSDDEAGDDSAVIEAEDVPALLRLAAEHDRVDILQELLLRQQQQQQQQQQQPPPPQEKADAVSVEVVPPLHVAVACGSMHAAACLLRAGADPSVRPCVPGVGDRDHKYDGQSAYELLVRRCNLAAGKRKGVEHAFFAEALRAIGADDAVRLRCLLASGMAPKHDDPDRNLTRWAADMTDNREPGGCFHLLQHWDDEEVAMAVEMGEREHVEPEKEHENKHEKSKADPSLIQLQRKLEESQAIVDSLNPILEDLTQETQVCQSLLKGSSSSNALVTHVKTMKANKAQKEVEFDQYQQLLTKAYEELDRLKYTYVHQYRLKHPEHTHHHDDRTEATDDGAHTTDDNPANPSNQILTVTSQLNKTEDKVRTLRASLTTMAEENARVVAEVDDLGLSGAVRLARSLRKDLLVVQLDVERAKEEEEQCRTHIRLFHDKLQRLHGDAEEEEEEERVRSDRSDEEEEEEEEEESQEEEQTSSVDYDSYDSDEYTTSSSLADDEEEGDEYTDDEEEDNAPLRPSVAIASGKSRSLIIGKSTRFPLDLWDLLCRIVGLGKTAVKETKKKAVVSIGRHTSGIMIV